MSKYEFYWQILPGNYTVKTFYNLASTKFGQRKVERKYSNTSEIIKINYTYCIFVSDYLFYKFEQKKNYHNSSF